MDLYFQDDWRLKDNLTFNLGVRCDASRPTRSCRTGSSRSTSTRTSPRPCRSRSGGTGPFTGEFLASLVTPDRNNIAPRLGLAWKPTEKWTLRAGYGVNFIVGAYLPIAQQLGVAAAVCDGVDGVWHARGRHPSRHRLRPRRRRFETQNTYGIDPRSASAYVHDLERRRAARTCRGRWSSARRTLGTRGGDLDVQRAPNRGPERPDDSRCAAVHLGGVARLFADELAQPPLPQAADARRCVRRDLHAVEVDGRCLDDRGGVWSSRRTTETWPRNGALQLRPAAPLQRRRELRAAVRPRSPLAQDRPVVGDRRRVDVVGQRAAGVGHAVHRAHHRRCHRRLAGHQRIAAGRLQRRADHARRQDRCSSTSTPRPSACRRPASSATPRATRIPGPGTTNANMALTRNVTFAGTRGLSIRVQANNIFNIVQFAGHRHRGQLADLRSRHRGAADAIGADRRAGEVLMVDSPRMKQEGTVPLLRTAAVLLAIGRACAAGSSHGHSRRCFEAAPSWCW